MVMNGNMNLVRKIGKILKMKKGILILLFGILSGQDISVCGDLFSKLDNLAYTIARKTNDCQKKVSKKLAKRYELLRSLAKKQECYHIMCPNVYQPVLAIDSVTKQRQHRRISCKIVHQPNKCVANTLLMGIIRGLDS